MRMWANLKWGPLLVVLLVAGGSAAAIGASSDGGTIHACAARKTGVLSLSSSGRCPRGAKAVKWGVRGQDGMNGMNGANGTTNLTVRTGTASIPTTCTSPGSCSGPSTTSSVSCLSGERATTGGYDITSASNGQPILTASRPNPVSGAPTGWAVSASAIDAGGPSSPAGPGPTVTFPIYVSCAAP